QEAEQAQHDQRDGHEVDALVAGIAVAFPVMGQQLVDPAGGNCGGIGCCGHVRSFGAENAPFWESAAMEDCKELDILSVTTTVGSREQAEALARIVMERRLAACVQLEEGMRSFYRWQGKECHDTEVRLTLKTLPECFEPLRRLIAEKHPYELPQF